MMPLVITGASGFLGRALLASLASGPYPEVRVLVHERMPPAPAGSRVTAVHGNLREPDTLRALLAPGATVINLAYLATARPEEDNLAAARNLLAACRAAGARRLVHCSTAVVAGGAGDDVITEETPCRPSTPYEKAKYRVEQALLEGSSGRFACAILRPTAAFGPGGRNLLTQVRRIARASTAANLLYAALQGTRRMNLVSAHNVAAALGFLATTERQVDGQAYIVSDDGDPLNNYRDVARILGRELGRGRVAGDLAFPEWLLSAALRARGRSSANPRRVYSDEKLRAAGLVKPWAFETALVEFARWARTQPGLGGPAR
jgi:nucleoside-diphosphate-sugar epimerase